MLPEQIGVLPVIGPGLAGDKLMVRLIVIILSHPIAFGITEV